MKTVTVPSKAFYKSWTFIGNVLMALPPVLDALNAADLPFTKEQWYLGIVLAVNVALRFKTQRPVAASDGKPVQVHTPTATLPEG